MGNKGYAEFFFFFFWGGGGGKQGVFNSIRGDVKMANYTVLLPYILPLHYNPGT